MWGGWTVSACVTKIKIWAFFFEPSVNKRIISRGFISCSAIQKSVEQLRAVKKRQQNKYESKRLC